MLVDFKVPLDSNVGQLLETIENAETQMHLPYTTVQGFINKYNLYNHFVNFNFDSLSLFVQYLKQICS